MTPDGINLNNSNTTSASRDVDGANLGVFGGYNWMSGPTMLYGIEGEISASNASGSHPGVAGPSFGFIRNGIDADVDWTGAIRGRLGYAMGQNLFYGTAGVAFARVTLDGTPGGGGAGGGAGGGPFNPSETLTGWTLGAGVEHAISENWTLRLDYRYSDVSGDFDFTSGGGGGPDPHTFDLEMQSHELRVGAGPTASDATIRISTSRQPHDQRLPFSIVGADRWQDPV
jgi:outer membrane immunogenic protein